MHLIVERLVLLVLMGLLHLQPVQMLLQCLVLCSFVLKLVLDLSELIDLRLNVLVENSEDARDL